MLLRILLQDAFLGGKGSSDAKCISYRNVSPFSSLLPARSFVFYKESRRQCRELLIGQHCQRDAHSE